LLFIISRTGDPASLDPFFAISILLDSTAMCQIGDDSEPTETGRWKYAWMVLARCPPAKRCLNKEGKSPGFAEGL